VPSFATSYTCPSCKVSTQVEVIDLGDPHAHIPGNTGEAMRRVRNLQGKPGDPVEEVAREILGNEAQMVLRYAICPACSAKNPAGEAATRAERHASLLFGLIFFGAIAGVAAFYSWVALILPVMDLFVFRPLMVLNAKKVTDKPFPKFMFAVSILLDIGLIAAILNFPRVAPLVPFMGIVQSLFGGAAKDQWKWDDAQKKLRFEAPETAVS
jgi:hypothetical protein